MPVDDQPARALRRALPAATGALICTLLLALIGVCAMTVPRARTLDGEALRALMSLRTDRTHLPLELAVHIVDPAPYAVASLILIAVAAARRRWASAVLLPVLLLGSGATTQLLKAALDRPRLADWLGTDLYGAVWPSGHATAAMALALGLVLVVPRAWRPPAAVVGGAFAIVVGTSTLALGWHFHSDVLGGYLVAAIWGLGVAAVLRVVAPAPAVAPAEHWGVAALLAALAGVLAAGLGVALAVMAPAMGREVLQPACVAALAAVAALASILTLGTSRVAAGR